MKKVLYISNIEVPYKVKFFNELSQYADLTVVYERRTSSNRDDLWAKSENNKFKKIYLDGIEIGNENSFSFSLLKFLSDEYDEIIISCINSYVQLMAILYMRLKKKKYILSFDGELFIRSGSIKSLIKKAFIMGAAKYLTAGEKSSESLSKIVGAKDIFPYYFSSYSEEELNKNIKSCECREKYVLVVGQYFDYKGLDIAVRIAKRDSNIKYKFVGMGKRTDLFVEEQNVDKLSNVEVVPFLKKDDLNREYQQATLLLLPSRQECWGLVINEAASFGTPIVSTIGSGAAIEFLSDYIGQYVFSEDDEEGLYNAIRELLSADNSLYSDFLRKKSKSYNIENMVRAHIKALEL